MCYCMITIDKSISSIKEICKKLKKRDDIIGVVTRTQKNEEGKKECKPLWIPINKHVGQIVVEIYKDDIEKTKMRLRRIKGVIDKPKRIDKISVSFLGESDSIDIELGHK